MASTIKVDNIQDQCGSAVVTKCGASKTLTVTTTKADNYQAADGGNIINQCGTTITLGASGDTVSLAAGATSSGFGATYNGAVNWDTTAKTADFTAVSGNGYFVNTTSGAITVTLPATPSAGDIVSLSDYASTWQTNNITLASALFNGATGTPTLSIEGQSVTFLYIDGTQGWKAVQDNTQNVTGAKFIVATGGTVTCCGDYKIHTFTSPGTFCVSCAGNSTGSNSVDYLVVAGGGGGGNSPGGGGGGGGGFRLAASTYPVACAPVSPISNPTGLPVSATAYPITVGAGGASSRGSNSVFSTITSTGGGTGLGCASAKPGGSGGGAREGVNGDAGGSGNTPSVSPPQGNPGGSTSPGVGTGGGGGGAIGTGQPLGSGSNGGVGAGIPSALGTNGESSGGYYYFSGGGGGGRYPGLSSTGGLGGGGDSISGGTGQAGATNTGGGAGGSERNGPGAATNGGSGIVIIRYKYQ